MMKKNQKLLNGVELFYKLALFGNRSSFLNRIAQLPSDKELAKGHQVPVENLSSLNDALKQKIESVASDIGDGFLSLRNKLLDFLDAPNPDLEQLHKTLVDASNAVPGNDTLKVQKALNLAHEVETLLRSRDFDADEESSYFEIPETVQVQSIPTRIQEQLNGLLEDLIQEGKISPVSPVKLTGKLDPETTRALNLFKKYHGRSANEPLSDTIKNIQALSNIKYVSNR